MRISTLVLAALLGTMSHDQVVEAVQLHKHHKHHHKKHDKVHVLTREDPDVKPGHDEPGAHAEEKDAQEDPDDAVQATQVVAPAPTGPAGDISKVFEAVGKVKADKA